MPKRIDAFMNRIKDQDLSEANFASCALPRYTECKKIHGRGAGDDSNLVGNIAKIVEDNAGSSDFVNCIDDSTTTCIAESVSKKMSANPELDYCDSFSEEIFKKNCLNETYPKIAIKKDDSSICNEVKDSFYKDYCFDSYNLYKSVKEKDISLCTRMAKDDGKESCKNNFYPAVAVATDDISFCTKAESKEVKNSCSEGYVRQKMMTFSTEAKCRSIYDLGTFFDGKAPVDALFNQCIDRIFMQGLSGGVGSGSGVAMSSADLKKLCELYTADDKKKMCLEQIKIKESTPAPGINSTPVTVPVNPIAPPSGTGAPT